MAQRRMPSLTSLKRRLPGLGFATWSLFFFLIGATCVYIFSTLFSTDMVVPYDQLDADHRVGKAEEVHKMMTIPPLVDYQPVRLTLNLPEEYMPFDTTNADVGGPMFKQFGFNLAKSNSIPLVIFNPVSRFFIF